MPVELGLKERVAQKQVAAATPYVGQSPPSGITRCKRFAHHKAEPSVIIVATGNLRGESQELFVDKALCVKVAE
jgi:hypothetical protein